MGREWYLLEGGGMMQSINQSISTVAPGKKMVCRLCDGLSDPAETPRVVFLLAALQVQLLVHNGWMVPQQQRCKGHSRKTREMVVGSRTGDNTPPPNQNTKDPLSRRG